MLVTSPEAGDGKTTVAANLGASLAHAGNRVVLVAGDLRRPALSEIFGLDGEAGLTAALRNGVDGSATTATDVPNLRILPTGRIEPDDVELLRPDRLRELFERLAADNDIVLVDAPPVLGVPDTLALAAAADAALLVIDAKKTTKGTIERAIRQLALVDAAVLGEVVNNFTPSDFGYYTWDDGHASAPVRRSDNADSAPDPAPEGNGAG